jgi:hypothetical protein
MFTYLAMLCIGLIVLAAFFTLKDKDDAASVSFGFGIFPLIFFIVTHITVYGDWLDLSARLKYVDNKIKVVSTELGKLDTQFTEVKGNAQAPMTFTNDKPVVAVVSARLQVAKQLAKLKVAKVDVQERMYHSTIGFHHPFINAIK